MTNTEIERLISKQYRPRKHRLKNALDDAATCVSRTTQSHGDRCAICARAEHGGGLLSYKNREGSEILLGKRCASFLDYLTDNPRAESLLN
jgi:hypothetical protein